MKRNEPTQRDKILSWMSDNPICATTLYAQHIPRAAARIGELRGEGWDIETRTCTQGHHNHRTRQVEYVLHNSPGWMSPDLAHYATPPPQRRLI